MADLVLKVGGWLLLPYSKGPRYLRSLLTIILVIPYIETLHTQYWALGALNGPYPTPTDNGQRAQSLGKRLLRNVS